MDLSIVRDGVPTGSTQSNLGSMKSKLCLENNAAHNMGHQLQPRITGRMVLITQASKIQHAWLICVGCPMVGAISACMSPVLIV